MIKKICLFLSLTFITIVTSADIPVYHFDADKKSWIAYVIPGLDGVYNITTAGPTYAWAIGYKRVPPGQPLQPLLATFFDGNAWQSAQVISDMQPPSASYDVDVFAATPLTGQSPVAWLHGVTQDIDGVIYHEIRAFDGKSWGTKSIRLGDLFPDAPKDGPSIVFLYSAGYAYAIQQQYPDGVAFNVANATLPNQWLAKPMIIQGIKHILAANTYNDVTPGFYLLAEQATSPTSVGQLYSCTINNVCAMVGPSFEYFPGTSPGLNVRDSSIYINYINRDQSHVIYQYSNDAGKTWGSTINPVATPSTFNAGLFFQRNFFNGIICPDFSGTSTDDQPLSCVDTKTTSATWYLSPQKINTLTQVYPSEKGAWLFNTQQQTTALTQYYSLSDNAITNKNIPASDLSAGYPKARIVNSLEVLLCGYDKDGQVSGYYFDGTAWQTQPLPDLQKCNVSTSPGYVYSSPDSNVWVF